MKIAFVYDAVYPWEKGGAQKRVWEIARRLASDHEIHMFGMKYWDGPAVIEREGVVLHGVCEPYDLYTDGRRSITQAIQFSLHLARPLLSEEFDVIDCQQFPYFPIFVSSLHETLTGSSLVVTWYEVWDQYWMDYLGYKGVFGRSIEQITVRLPDEIVSISGAIQEDLRGIGRRSNVSVVPNGVDFDGLQAVPESDADPDIVYVGRLSEHKNVDLLLDAVAQITASSTADVSCTIVGDGPERERLEAHACEVGVAEQVTFRGFVEADDDVVGIIKSATVFVLPSEREGFPNTILEANACGIPAIVADYEENGGTAVVDDGVNGFVVEPTPEAFADRIEHVLTDETARADLATDAREFGKRHDWDRIVDQLADKYRDLA
ncbi:MULTISPECIES: glycosyltransferase family 4 protein [Haloarcula]|uniref:glycosyltransferase family 4 protein n=1 Tax=Haloarcula TaxID=2237 RepID=UPI0023EAD43F|nr:glycosyltransferase family 4 protein [Halomicroarcula sp. XH51]